MIKINFTKYRIIVILSKCLVLGAIITAFFAVISPFIMSYVQAIGIDVKSNTDLGNYEYESYAEKPKFYGVDNKNQSYQIKAESGVQQTESEILLECVDAKYVLENNAVISMHSKNGAIDIETNKIETKGENKMVYDDKYSLSADLFELYYKDAIGYGKSKVLLESKMGEIRSEEVEIKDNYETIRFFGNRVKTTLFVENMQDDKKQ
ncbi:MAG: hypothetical protein ACK5WS_01655 [Alphaproteobacteria bacterium]